MNPVEDVLAGLRGLWRGRQGGQVVLLPLAVRRLGGQQRGGDQCQVRKQDIKASRGMTTKSIDRF